MPDILKIAKRTMNIVKMNLVFTTVYNLLGLSLASMGILPPVLAAAAQSLPDIGIMGNSARLLKQNKTGMKTKKQAPTLSEPVLYQLSIL